MKKVLLTLLVLIVLAVMTGADIRRKGTTTSGIVKKFCQGYTIIEFGKGIDCNGDTLTLVKVDGGQALLRERKEPS